MRTITINSPGPQGPVGPTGPQGPSVPFTNIGNDVYATTSSLQVTGSFLVSGSSTFTNIGPAVFSGSVNATSGVTMSSALVSGDVTVLGTASINVLQINTTINSTGSNQLGDAANDTQTLYGSVIIPTGSLTVSGNVSFGTSSAGFYWNNANGYLGIKKTNPAVEIDVVGSIRATGTVFNSTTQTQIIQVNSGVSALRFFSGSVETARYDGNNWGFYTTTPTARLQVKGSGTTSATTALRVENTNASASLVVLDDGAVGIGTTSPATTLQIAGTTTTQNILVQTGATYDIGVNATRFRDGWFSRNVQCGSVWTANIAIAGTNLTFYNNLVAVLGTLFSTGNLLLSTGTQTDAGYRLAINSSGSLSGSLYITGSSNQTLLRIDSPASSSILFVSGSGNVGIGTSSPSAKFDIYSTSLTQSVFSVGESLASKLSFNQSSFRHQLFSLSRIGGTSPALLYIGAGSGPTAGSTIIAANNDNLIFGYDISNTFNETFRITTNKNVLIGTTTDSARLMVKGSGTTSATTTLRVENANTSASLLVRDDGFVGIGTTTPSGRLDVSAGLGTQTAGDLVVDTTNNIVYVGKLDSVSGNTNLIFRNRLGGVKSKWANAGAGSIWFGDFVSGYGVGIQQSGITTETTLPGSAIFHVDKGILGGTVASFINGNVGIGTTSPSTTLDVSGSGRFTNNLTVTGSATISNILTLTPQSPLPSGVATGSFAVSSSVPPKPYFYDGTTWNALY